MSAPNRADEARHTPDPDEPLWNESYYLDWFAEDLSVGGYVRIGFYPNLGRVWYWACLVGPDRPLVTVIDHEVPMPSSPSSLEVRTDGLWADHAIETPLDHMSINLESFGLQVDHPADVYHSQPRGALVPFGFELDFHTDRAAYQWPPVTPRYEIPCRVEGVVSVGDERIEVDGWGQRDHSWGAARDGGPTSGAGTPAGSTTAPASTPPAGSSPTTTGASPIGWIRTRASSSRATRWAWTLSRATSACRPAPG